MFRKPFLFIALFLLSVACRAQADSSRLQISLLTCGVGDEIWEQFGHTAVRIVDSNANTDLVYNYGTFEFGEGFEIKFMRGKLLYYLSVYPYINFLEEYKYLQRSVEEQVLNIGGAEKKAIQAYLQENAKEENKYYKYDFFFDNCATRIRDIFPNALGNDFQFGRTLPEDSKLTYRQIMNKYFYRVHFERVGCNLLLGSKTDGVMSNTDVMFLPDFLRDGVAGATVNGKPIAGKAQVVIPETVTREAGPNWIFYIMLVLALLTVAGLSAPGLKILGNIMSFFWLFITGVLGCIILIMWFWTDHQGCQNNFNILWALPTNLIMAFLPKKNKGKYAVVAIILIFMSLLLHLFRVQQLPLLELSPLLLSLIFVYGSIIRRNRHA